MKNWIRKSWLVAGLLCVAPIATVVSGCGGGGSTVPQPQSNPFTGFYAGTFLITNGPKQGTSGAFSVRVQPNGDVVFTSPGSNNPVVGRFTSQADFGSFKFDLPSPSGVTFTIDGQVSQDANGKISGNGTFVSTDGTTGTITLDKVA